MAETITQLIGGRPADAPAIGGADRAWLTYRELDYLANHTRTLLNRYGIGRSDRVAIVLPNGPELAACFVTVATSAVTAPLNPAYREEEFDFYLSDLKAKALIVGADEDGPAIAAARRHGCSLFRLTPAGHAAGDFELEPEDAERSEPLVAGAADSDDTALVLHTSGTTSRPKIVPLLHRNVCASARNVGAILDLGETDRCLNIMPLFHIHGLIAAVLASLGAGGSVWCSPGFNALRFFGWLDEVKPSWYTAVPTMHQAILARAGRNPEVIERAELRFIRSSSAALPAPVMAELETVFGCPVLESYGMTEAAHQMASNPLPPGPRKPGSVGVAAGPAIRIADVAEPVFKQPGETGEVVISGPNVTPGYEANPEANAQAFFETDGERWFRTGDEGFFDADDHLKITGRLKEIINRGGEKVSPHEIDNVLMDHPAVQQVVTFAMPHEKLGEEVAAAIVLKEGQDANEHDIRAFASEHLADFKVPRKIMIVPEIPRGATGKLQRIGLAHKLGLAE